jgi:hypothetical protein
MDYRTLLTHGRKAGLNTRDIYQALSVRPPAADDRRPGLADGYGLVSVYGRSGQRIYQPTSSPRRP